MPKFLGTSTLRKEDPSLLSGRGRYADDMPVPAGTLHAHVVRSPHPHAGVLFMDFLLSDAQSILATRDFIPTNVKVKPLPAGLTLKFVDPAKLLDENDKWEKLYKDIITNQGR